MISNLGQAWGIIPARGGSKGIPRKNLRPIAGIPLIAHTILAAKGSKIQRVIVSTDDLEIAAVARQWGAEVVMRPAEISGDTASSESALIHVLEQLGRPEWTVFLQCTSPLTKSVDIDRALDVIQKESADSLVTVAPFLHFLWEPKTPGKAEFSPIRHETSRRPMRQERLGKEFLESGNFYVMKTEGLLKSKSRFFGKIVAHELPKESCFEIDDPIDLDVAEVLVRKSKKDEATVGLLENAEALVLDFDGVMTPNSVVVHEDGREAVICSRGDGMGITLLRKNTELKILCLSKEKNPVVSQRCKKLGIECLQGIDEKESALVAWGKENGTALEKMVYVGNDINDLDCLKRVGLPVVVQDSHPDVVPFGRIWLKNLGGQGAVREICDLLIAHSKRRKK
ncbi:MAG: acylneuraminate cytidylyltransferase [Bdellovibrionales bacterium]|nr:acylneuraminate cytidylyltransferase [Bdellovibrionales bacterium]